MRKSGKASRSIARERTEGREGGGVERKRSGASRVRFAVVGLGHIAQVAVLPAFRHASRHAELRALVSSDETKLRELSKRYRVPIVADYEGYDALLESGEIDAVYIALPNSQHREFAERAARRGVHVLCEKPMALTPRDCEAMIRAARAGGSRLMIAYRLHFEAANLRAIELVSQGKLGQVRFFDSVFSMLVGPENIRGLPEEQGGGPLYDIGIYCINAARYLMRAEPEEVVALGSHAGDRRVKASYDTLGVVMRFPGERVASFTCSFASSATASYRVVGTKGSLTVDNAYEYTEAIEHELVVEGKKSRRSFAKRDQFAPELIHFSECVREGRDPEPSGFEGVADIRVIDAIQRSLKSGRAVRLAAPGKGARRVRRPSMRQEIRRPAVRKPELVKVKEPSKDN